MKSQQLKQVKARMSRAGFDAWQVAAVRRWAAGVADPRKARRLAKKVFGV